MLQAIGIDGITPIWLWSEGTGTEIDPYKSNFYAYQGGSWNVSVDNFPSVTGLTNAELRADPLSVSGTVTLASESGYLTYRNTALSNTPATVKGTAGGVFGWNFINHNTTPIYVKFYDTLSVVLGSTTPIDSLLVPPGDGVTPGMYVLEPSLIPYETFATAISIACVTGLADNSTAAPSTPIYAKVRYK